MVKLNRRERSTQSVLIRSDALDLLFLPGAQISPCSSIEKIEMDANNTINGFRLFINLIDYMVVLECGEGVGYQNSIT